MTKVLLTYDATSGIFQSQLNAFISSNKYIISWSFLFPGSYFIKSESLLPELVTSFAPYFGETRFVMVRFDDDVNDVVNGKLSPDIWRWLTDMNKEDFAAAQKAYALRRTL